MSFATLVGNERNKKILQRLLRGGRAGATLIFAGPEGVGKRQFALTMAKVANCRESGDDSCDRCPVCRRIDEGTHGDIINVTPDGQFIKVAQTRAMNEEVFYRPREGRQRFFLIDEAERLRDESANSLLKTLEEPPSTSTIILITSRPDALLQTIRSRAQRLTFAPLSLAEMESFLAARYPRPAAETSLVARLAAGSIGEALTVDLSVYRQDRRLLLELIELLTDEESAAGRFRLMKAAEFLAKKDRDQFEHAIDCLNALLRDILLISGGAGEGSIVNVDIAPNLKDIALRLSIGRLILWVERFSELRRQLRVNVNRQIAAEAVLLAIAALNPASGERDARSPRRVP